MDSTTPPPIPGRSRHTRRRSLQGPSEPANNRTYVQPASPEVISSLITSLSIISSPANQLFENHSVPNSPAPANTSFNHGFSPLNTHNGQRTTGGSFGIDYGAYDQPSLRDMVAEEESLDELAASPPVIRTAKPPSGFSPLTAPKSRDSSPLKLFRSSSRPSSTGSSGSRDRDDESSIGNLSIEPGVQPTHELRRKSSGDSWGKKQGRNQRGLMYMSSKERLRENEQDRKRSSTGAIGNTKTRPDRLALPNFEPPQFRSDSFMAETPIGEESDENPPRKSMAASRSPTKVAFSPGLAGGSQGGIGSGKFIPTRDSSLRNSTASSKKRSSHRSSRHSTRQNGDEADDTIHELDEQQINRESNRRSRTHAAADATSKLMEPLDSLEMPRPARNSSVKKATEPTKENQMLAVEEMEEGAPSPAVSQRKPRPSPDRGGRSSSQIRHSQKAEPVDNAPKRSSSRLKRLSAPLSPRTSDSYSRNNSQARVTSPEPNRAPQIQIDERPTSADSIDDAVDAYLCSPRLSQKIKHPQTGRTISFSEVGDSEGFAVFCCVGMGLTRYITAFYDELALTLKLRLITPDRPGVGDSEPYNDGTATPLSWPGISTFFLKFSRLLISHR